MVQAIRDFAEGLRRRLGIVIECRPCGRRYVCRAQDLAGRINPAKPVERTRWRCARCGTRAVYVRWTLLDLETTVERWPIRD